MFLHTLTALGWYVNIHKGSYLQRAGRERRGERERNGDGYKCGAENDFCVSASILLLRCRSIVWALRTQQKYVQTTEAKQVWPHIK